MSFCTVPNFISLLRIPLAFLYFKTDLYWRTFALITALFSDGLDGFLARRYKRISRFGTFLDPLMDKFFVLVVLSILIHESKIAYWEAMILMSRDFSVFLFGVYLVVRKKWAQYQFRSIWAGKLTTCCQFFVLLSVTYNCPLPAITSTLFVVLGVLALVELYMSDPVPSTLS